MKRKRFLSTLLCGSMAVSMAAGASVTSLAEENLTDDVTLRILACSTGYEDAIEEAVSEAYPNITIEWEIISWNDLESKMQQYIQSGMPDIVIGKSQDANNYGSYGVWADLSHKPYIEKVAENAMPGVTVDGQVLGMSYTALFGGIFYNRAIFNQYDLEVPTSWEEMDHVVEVLESNGVTPFATHYMENILYTTAIVAGNNLMAVSQEWGEEFKNGERSATDTEFSEGYECVKYMMDHSWDDTYSVDQTTCDARFISGEAAMQMDGSWVINNYLELDDTFDFGLFPVPDSQGVNNLIFEPDITFFQSADTEYPEYVDAILTLMTDPDVAASVCDAVSEGSLIEGVEVNFNNPCQSDIDNYVAKNQIIDQNIITNQLPASGFWDECSSDVSEWLNGNMTLEEALAAADGRRSVCGFKTVEE